MSQEIRNLNDATPGQITATPAKTLNKLAIKVMRVKGVASGRRK